jgi:hypothetical protein|tara:strand:+ start:58 stop:285 length:228 start_codon:yes stop_codon:yes gene_type:complete
MSYNAIISKILDNIVTEVNKEENMDRIKKNVIEPIIHNTMYQLYPYILIFAISMITMFVLVFTILFLNIKLCYKE